MRMPRVRPWAPCQPTDRTKAGRLEIVAPAEDSEGRDAALLVANANGFLDLVEEDFAVADLAGGRALQDGVDGGLDKSVVEDHFDLDLGQ